MFLLIHSLQPFIHYEHVLNFDGFDINVLKCCVKSFFVRVLVFLFFLIVNAAFICLKFVSNGNDFNF